MMSIFPTRSPCSCSIILSLPPPCWPRTEVQKCKCPPLCFPPRPLHIPIPSLTFSGWPSDPLRPPGLNGEFGESHLMSAHPRRYPSTSVSYPPPCFFYQFPGCPPESPRGTIASTSPVCHRAIPPRLFPWSSLTIRTFRPTV